MVDWRSWAVMPNYLENSEVNELFEKSYDVAAYTRQYEKYEAVVKTRIAWLEGRISKMSDADRAEAHFVLACLFDKLDDECPFKREVRYHCIKAVRLNSDDHRVWELLAMACSWVSVIGKSCGVSLRPINMPGMCSSTPEAARQNRSVFESDRAPPEGGAPRSRFRLRWAQKAVRFMQRAVRLMPSWPPYRKQLKTALRERMTEFARLAVDGR